MINNYLGILGSPYRRSYFSRFSLEIFFCQWRL